MNLCLYGASSNEIDSDYIRDTEELGRRIARRSHGLVFGGGAQGLMGAAARGVTEAEGYLLGIAPKFFNVDGILYQNCTEFLYTETMRERKQLMEDHCDGFIVTPGGIGTYEEFFEILTLKQLGRHRKPIALFNLKGYFDPMNEMLEQCIRQNFMKPVCRALCRSFEEPEAMLDYLEQEARQPLDASHFKNI